MITDVFDSNIKIKVRGKCSNDNLKFTENAAGTYDYLIFCYVSCLYCFMHGKLINDHSSRRVNDDRL